MTQDRERFNPIFNTGEETGALTEVRMTCGRLG